jgi:MATE family multidrug resistance protein
MHSINKDILKLAVPSILANITVPIVGMVDIAVAGHLDTNAATMIGGIAVGSMLFDLLYWNFGFLRVGTGGLTAQAFGRKDWKECSHILTRALGMSLAIACCLLLIQWVFVKAAFMVVDCTPQVRELASRYFFIRIWAAPATLSLMALKGWFIGMQDSVSPMVTDFVVNGMNILMSIVLALGITLPAGFGSVDSGLAGFALAGHDAPPASGMLVPAMGFPGIALGTVVAQYSGLFVALMIVVFKYRRRVFEEFVFADLKAVFKGGETRRFFVMNADLFVRSLCFIAIYIGFTVISARYGDLLLAVSSIMMKILMIFSYFTDGFAYAGEAMTGRYIGACDDLNLRRTVKWTFVWSMGLALIFIGIYHFGGVLLLKMMTSDMAVVEASADFLPWLLLMPVVGCAAFTWDGIFIGATGSREMRNSMLWSVVAFAGVWFVGILLLDIHSSDSAGIAASISLPPSSETLSFQTPSETSFSVSTHDMSKEPLPAVPDQNPSRTPGATRYGIIAMHILMAAYFAHLLARTIYLTVKSRDVVRIS